MKAVNGNAVATVDFDRAEGRRLIGNYFGRAASMEAGPQAYLVGMPDPASRISPHFHDIDQFQVAVAGDGHFGKQPFLPGTVQFADAFTPYGPIIAGDKGLSFFTLRIAPSGGHFDMPGSRHLLQGKPGRNISAVLEPASKTLAAHQVASKPLIPAQSDGLAAVALHMGANSKAAGRPSDGGGQYCLVYAGSLSYRGESYGARSLFFVEPGEPDPEFEAGAQGAQLLIMQYPRPSERPGSDPDKLAMRDTSSEYIYRTGQS